MEIKKMMRELERDYVHGSSWYFSRISEILKSVDDFEEFTLWLEKLRPGMAPLSLVSEILKEFHPRGKEDLEYLSSVLLDEINEAKIRIGKNAPRNLGNVITVSYSSAVLSLISNANVDRVYLLRSNPGTEYRDAAREYGKFSDVVVIPDSSCAYFAGKADYVLTGFDGIYRNGFISNKIGTRPLLISAAEEGKDVIAAGESYKAQLENPSDMAMKKIRKTDGSLKIPLLELIPLKYITKIISDIGTLEPSEISVQKMYSSFRGRIESRIRKFTK
ncbi:MAG: hypothetical protein QXP25_01380 [Thermoplasmatales archaeon]